MSDELQGSLRTAVEAMRHVTVSTDSLQRALNRAKQIDCSEDRIRKVAPVSSTRPRWRWFAAAAALIVAVALGLVFVPTTSLGWADVSKAMQAQRWIRLRNERDGEIWVSPEQKVWAFKVNSDWIMFGDETQRAKYEFRRRRNPSTNVSLDEAIIKTSLGAESVARMLPLNDLSGDGAAVKPWIFGTTTITDQKRREVTEGGKRWIEFELTLSPLVGPMYHGTLRVDPKTGLPAFLLEKSDAGNAKKWEREWEFDYPERGPLTIYDLGVARDLAIDNRMPTNEVQRVLDAMTASRARIGDFRLVIFQSDAGASAMPSIPSPYVVWRKGERWRVDRSAPYYVGGRPMFGPAVGQSWDDWLEERLKQPPRLYVCDGKTVYKNVAFSPAGPGIVKLGPENAAPQDVLIVKWQPEHAAPQDLLSGDRSARSLASSIQFAREVYPDLTVPPGWTFEFDPQPADAVGCVLIRISAELGGQVQRGHEWYYIDPAKGHAVVRTEMFNLPIGEKPDHLPADRQTIRMEEFQQSPTGSWYPTVIHESRLARPAMINDIPGSVPRRDATIQYRFDFDAELPDSLFVVEKPE